MKLCLRLTLCYLHTVYVLKSSTLKVNEKGPYFEFKLNWKWRCDLPNISTEAKVWLTQKKIFTQKQKSSNLHFSHFHGKDKSS